MTSTSTKADRVAVVTGAASGIGMLAARRLSADGWAVAAVDRSDSVRGLFTDVPRLQPFVCDVSDAQQVRSVAAEIEQQMGGVARLVNAAGIAIPGRIDELEAERFATSMMVNYLGTVHWVKAVLPAMLGRDAGEIVLLASMAGWLATPGMGAYTATKFALVGFAETLRRELEGSRVVLRCVCPPAVETPMLAAINNDQALQAVSRLVKPITAADVLDAVDASLRTRRRSIFVFPGRGSTTMWRLRRHAPRLLDSAIRRIVPPA